MPQPPSYRLCPGAQRHLSFAPHGIHLIKVGCVRGLRPPGQAGAGGEERGRGARGAKSPLTLELHTKTPTFLLCPRSPPGLLIPYDKALRGTELLFSTSAGPESAL